MDEYISREAALKKQTIITERYHAQGADEEYHYKVVRSEDIQALPAADVKPVVKGEWIWDAHTGRYHCSKCGEPAPLFEDGDDEYIYNPNFCPNCGADMRKEQSYAKQ